MTISFTRYVDIISGVGGASQVAQRQLIARLFSESQEIPTNGILEFSSADDVAAHFGSSSEEYLRAAFYFGFISKNTTRPRLISYARWASADTSAEIRGGTLSVDLAALQAITAGVLTVTLGAITEEITGIDFSGAASFADVASTLQGDIQAANVAPIFASATVAYDAVRNRFILTAGATGANAIAVSSSTDLDVTLSWVSALGAIISQGVAAQSITDILASSTSIDNNFGSFAFVPELSDSEIIEAATWNNTNNVLFQFHTPVTSTNAATIEAAIKDFAGCGMTLKDPTASDYPEMLPMAVLAATNYAARASVQNYMYQQGSGLVATVTSNSDANLYDGLRVNYYGRTQQAGQLLEFYQRGVLTGPSTAPRDMNTFANEQWFKDAAGVLMMNLFLGLARVPANNQGRGQILTALQGVILQALENGTISVGRPLSEVQKAFITEQTGDENAFQQIAISGYWIDVEIQQSGEEFIGVYKILYTKDDALRKIEGTHTLI